MYVVTLVTQKGGSGKSTLTVGLAVAAMEDADRVAVIEADLQGTVSSWRRRRTNPYPRVDRVADRVEIERAIPRLRAEGVRLAIIDTAATNNNLSSCAISVADFCLIPARPSPADIEAALPTLTTIRRFNRRFAFVLNQTPPRGYRLSEAATALNSLGVLALPFIVQRNDYQDALGAGLGVTEFAPEGKASEEIRALWGWVAEAAVCNLPQIEPTNVVFALRPLKRAEIEMLRLSPGQVVECSVSNDTIQSVSPMAVVEQSILPANLSS